MQIPLKWRFIIIGLCVVLSVLMLLPTIFSNSTIKKHLPFEKIRLGLDLQGGMHLVLGVDTDKAIRNNIERVSTDFVDSLKQEGLPVRIEGDIRDNYFTIEIIGAEAEEKLKRLLEKTFSELEQVSINRNGNILSAQLRLKDSEMNRIRSLSIEQAVEIIRNRIDQFGVTEPTIQKHGEDMIIVQFPGIKDPQRAIELIGKTAQLEFKLVDEERSVEVALKGEKPEDDEILYMKTVDRATGRTFKTPILLKKRTLLTGEFLKKAQVSMDPTTNEPYVAIEFNERGAKIFDKITSENVGKRLAIILDNTVYSAPVIKERISGGRASITGNFDLREAQDLAIVLRAGALPAPVKILEKRTVGPSLGIDSIKKGILSITVGGALVFIFMAVYYRASGIIADMALILNLLFIMATLAAFNATLTLPGIAGIVLTMGMAVDANVLIFERTREELRSGKTPKAALDAGYSKAFITILDSNLTTVFAAIILFQFGTGPVKGFGVTLTIGIIVSMFTAIFVTRTIFDYFYIVKKVKRISI